MCLDNLSCACHNVPVRKQKIAKEVTNVRLLPDDRALFLAICEKTSRTQSAVMTLAIHLLAKSEGLKSGGLKLERNFEDD